MIRDDITLARHLCDLAVDHPELEAITDQLSITTLRYVPGELRAEASLAMTPVPQARSRTRLLGDSIARSTSSAPQGCKSTGTRNRW